MELTTLKRLLIRLKVPPETINETSDGGGLTCQCPLAKWTHKKGCDRRPSFWAAGGPIPACSCFSCETKGTIKDLLRTYGKLSGDYVRFEDYAGKYDHIVVGETFVEDKVEMQIPEELMEGFQDFRDFPEAEEYLGGSKGRALNLSVCDEFNVLFDAERNMVVFPIRGTHGKLVGACGRSLTDKRFHNYFHAKLAGTLGGANKLSEDPKAIIVVEGWIDLISATPWAKKFGADVVCTWTSRISAGQAAILSSWICPIVCGYDSDEAGNKGWRTFQSYWGNISGNRIRRMTLPDGCDMNDLLEHEFDIAYENSLSLAEAL